MARELDIQLSTKGKSLIAGYTDDETAILPLSAYVLFGDHTRIVKYVDYEFAQGADGLKILLPDGDLLPRYAYHAMASLKVPSRGYNRHWSELAKLSIPVPPMEVQEEIVRVLDSFAELEAELEARRRQYAYYRDILLTFEERVSRVTLGEICLAVCSGGTPNKKHPEFYENGSIPWLRTQQVAFNEIHEVDSYITEAGLKGSSAKWIPANCVIVAISGATAGRCAINKIPLTTNQHCLNMEIDASVADYRYVYHCICKQNEELLSLKEGARGDLNASRIKGLTIPLPSLEEQRRIVAILDQFDALVNDFSQGIPAEIEARRKQYEHYRDRLLDFPRKELSA